MCIVAFELVSIMHTFVALVFMCTGMKAAWLIRLEERKTNFYHIVAILNTTIS